MGCYSAQWFAYVGADLSADAAPGGHERSKRHLVQTDMSAIALAEDSIDLAKPPAAAALFGDPRKEPDRWIEGWLKVDRRGSL